MRTDVKFACEQFAVSERWACKLLRVERSSYRYEPRPDRNAELRETLIALARQKPRYGYRRLHALMVRREQAVSVIRIYRLYRAEGLADATELALLALAVAEVLKVAIQNFLG